MAEPTTDKSGSEDIDDIDVELVDDPDDPKSDPDNSDGDDPVNDDDKVTPDDDPADDTSTDKTPAFDEDLDKWAESVGEPIPTTDRERELTQKLRDSQRDFTRERQAKAQDLAKSIKEATPKSDDDTVVDPLEKEVRELRTRQEQIENNRLMSEYLIEQERLGTPLTVEEQEAMAAVLQDADADTFRVLTKGENIDLWRAAGQRRLAATTDVDAAVAEKARKEERERLAKASKAGGPSRDAHAKTSGIKKDEVVEIWDDDSI